MSLTYVKTSLTYVDNAINLCKTISLTHLSFSSCDQFFHRSSTMPLHCIPTLLVGLLAAAVLGSVHASPATSCHLTMSRSAHVCGFGYLHYGHYVILDQEPVHLNATTCQHIVNNQTISIDNHTWAIPLNRPFSRSYYSHGFVDRTGACTGVTFRRGDTTWSSAYEITTITGHIVAPHQEDTADASPR